MLKDYVDFFKEIWCPDGYQDDTEDQDDFEDQEDAIMICPYCRREMTTGVMRSYKGKIKWGEGPNTIDWFGFKHFGASWLGNDEGFGTSRVTSYYCYNCKKIIIDTDLV